MKTSYEKGVIAESVAVRNLENLGYEILARRLRTPYGEIDILAKNGDDIIAIEVKQRRTLSDARECISSHQMQRIYNALLFVISSDYASNMKYVANYRIDVICIDYTGHYEHIKNAFSCYE